MIGFAWQWNQEELWAGNGTFGAAELYDSVICILYMESHPKPAVAKSRTSTNGYTQTIDSALRKPLPKPSETTNHTPRNSASFMLTGRCVGSPREGTFTTHQMVALNACLARQWM